MSLATQWVEAAEERVRFLGEQLDALEAARARLVADAGRADELLARARRELCGYLLPDVEEADLRALEQRLQYPGLLPILREHERQLQAAYERRAALGAMDEVVHHGILLAEVDDELAEAMPAFEAFRKELDLWEASPWFAQLRGRGWLEVGYEPVFLDVVRDWRAVSFLMAELEDGLALELADSDAVRARFARVSEDAAPVLEQVAIARARRAEILAIEAEFRELGLAPERILAALYDALGEAILDHIDSSAAAFRFDLGASDPMLASFMKKISGLEKKGAYLRELAVTRVDAQAGPLTQQVKRLKAKIATRRGKIARGRAVAPSVAELNSMRDLQADKWARRHDKLDKLRQRLSGFDAWDSGSVGDDVLWWDVMTHGAPAEDIHEVRAWHRQWGAAPDRHPHAALSRQHDRHDEPVGDAAQAMAAAMVLADDRDLVDAS